MTQYFEQLFGALRSVTLSERERQNLRLQIEAYVRENPLQAPLHIRFLAACRRASQSFEQSFNSRTFISHPAVAACVLVLCVGVGTSYAASSALPGEPLYAFKTRVNEPVQGALAFSPEAKAQWSAELTNRRIEEAEVLAISGKLSPVTSAAIETSIDAALANFENSVTLLSKKEETEQVADVQSDLEASLNAHETVLVSLGQAAKSDVTPIVSKIREHAEKITEKRYATEVTIAAKNDTSTKNAALKKKQKAETQVKQAALLSATASGTPIATSVTAISEEAQSDIKDGDSEAKNGQWGKAYGAFQAAIRKLKENKTNADVRARLKVQIAQQTSTSTSTSAAASTTTTTTSTTTDSIPDQVKDDTKKDEDKKDDTSGSKDKKIDLELDVHL